MTGYRSIAAGFRPELGGAGRISAGCLLFAGGDRSFDGGGEGKTGGFAPASVEVVAFGVQNRPIAAESAAKNADDASTSAGWKKVAGQNALVSAGVTLVAAGSPRDAAGDLSRNAGFIEAGDVIDGRRPALR